MSFIFKITTTTSPQTFVIPCVNEGTFNATVDYGDGTGSQTVTAYDDSNLTHTFATAGQHTITIDGTFPNVRFYDNASSRALVDEVVDLGDVGWVKLYRAFRDCANLTTFNLGTGNTSNVADMSQWFERCVSLTTLDLSNLDTSSLTNAGYMFQYCTSLTTLDLSNFNTSSVTTMTSMFKNCTSLTTLDVSSFDTSNVTIARSMFYLCSSLTTLDVSSFDTSSMTNMQEMFRDCKLLTTLDVSNFNTSSVTNMSMMFSSCATLTSLALSNFNTSSVTNMSYMFISCSNLTALDVSSFDTSSVTNVYAMFNNCRSLTTLDLSSFDTSSVTGFYAMFYNCENLTTLDLSSFNTSSVTDMRHMFNSCLSLITLDLSNFNTSQVWSMHEMFRNCRLLTTLDISNFDTSNVTSTYYMFGYCLSLTELDVASFNTSLVRRMDLMFTNCTNLTNLNIKHFNISSVTRGNSFLQNANNALTTTQYDELLEAWAVQDVQPDVGWHFGNPQYTDKTIANWYSTYSNSSLSIINNKIVSIAANSDNFGVAQQIDNLIIGSSYVFKGKATCSNSSATVKIRVGTNSFLSANIYNVQGTESVTVDTTFVATATTHYIGAIASGHAANDTVTIDAGITVKEITNYTEANAASEIEYSQENVFRSEEVVNGDFATDLSGYTFNAAAWEWDGGKASKYLTPDSSSLEQLFTFVTGKAYSITVEWSDVSGGNPVLKVGNANTIIYPKTTAVVIGANQSKFSLSGNAALFKVDNISIKEITNAVEYKNIPQTARKSYKLENDIWTGGEIATPMSDYNLDSTIFTSDSTGVSVNFTGGSAVGAWLYSSPLEIYTDYKVSVNVSDHTRGGLSARLRTGNTVLLLPEGLGVNSAIVKSGGGGSTTIRTRTNQPVELRFNNISVKEIIEVAKFIEQINPVTVDMTLTSSWIVRGETYKQLSSKSSGSVRVDATISNTDNGILMEAGGDTVGLILYVYAGVLYFQCGRATGYGTSVDRSETSYILPTGEFDYIVEWSANTENSVLYINGLKVDSQNYSYNLLSGSDEGTVGEIKDVTPTNRGGFVGDGNGVYSNTITKCDIFVNQVTSDV